MSKKQSSEQDQRSFASKEALMERRTVVVEDRIEAGMIGEIIGRLIHLQIQSPDPITLLINSGGGSVNASLELCDFITHILTAPVHAVALGNCHSAATFIMLHCEKRMCTPHAGFIIHSGTMNDVSLRMDETTEKNLGDLLEDSRRTTEMIIRMYMRKLGTTRAKVKELIGRGDQDFNGALDATEAKSIGLVQHIVKDKLDIFQSPSRRT